MTYTFGNKVICVETDHVMDGKRPGLYIGNKFCISRVARFTNADDAQWFADHLRAILEQYGIVGQEAIT